MKTKKITWKILPCDTLKCMICCNVAIMRVSVPWEITELNLCLCAGCAKKPAYRILEEVMENG